MLELRPERPPHADQPIEQAVSVTTFHMRIGEKDGRLLSVSSPSSINRLI